jgi:hypothetical protein
MARKRKKAIPESVITRLGVRVESSDMRIDAGVNIDARHPQYALSFHEEDPVYTYVTRVTLKGIVTSPPERAGDRYEIAVSGDEAPSRRVSPTLKQLQDRDEFQAPKYRDYRGGSIPVYRKIPGLGLVDKARGEPQWYGWANVSARLVSDMLVLLNSGRPLYLAIEERREGRTRWIDGVGLHTTDPADD